MLILSLIMLFIFAAVNATALSEDNDSIGDAPDLPLILQGEMDLNGQPASAGCEITAYYEGELIAKSTVGEGVTPENYTNIGDVELYVDGNKASSGIPVSNIENIESKEPGSIIEVDINNSASSSVSGTESRGSSGSTGEARVVNKNETADSKTSDKAGGRSEASLAGEDDGDIVSSEEPVSQSDDAEDLEDEDAEGAENTEDAGYSTVFTALVFIAALFSAVMVIKR
ncbi:Hypothetical protein MmTuc01_1705 [Methanosarcina mazei Tuc01]|uniref:Uncharacterized protein n=1 Tax=Methanosarcina mazei Tuc01 TaxID=1236903 RepID=M1P9B1_METMZ|nr:Hypothetical protein MmTuc01_1705 [Methanosarcina mazei Tuc01]